MTSKLLQLRAGLRRRAIAGSIRRQRPGVDHTKHNRTRTRGNWTAIRLIGALWLLVPACGAVGGCSNPGIPDRPPRSGADEPVVTVTGDWDDIDAAIARAAPQAAVAVLSNEYADTVERVVALLSADGQRVRLRFTSGGDSDPRPITIEASFGEPDDPGRSAALVRLIATELRALAGRDIAPR
ncbi:MAG: hypothetical protein AAFN41_00130 [Planctomycetota bacterium]